MQAYLDYQVYPTLGIDTGLGYALNTFFKYLLIAIGFLIALNIVGIDLRFFLVFAGAIGIGIGLGLQSMAANVIAGFTIIFGGKIRKGDWIEMQGTLGMVTDIYLRAAKVRTRDNIEYLVPNSELISNIIVNYSLSSPMVRIDLPVGVSYDADPKEVERILMDVAEKEPLLSKDHKPAVRFVEYGDNSINFELLFWIDIQKHPRRRVRLLYLRNLKKRASKSRFPSEISTSEATRSRAILKKRFHSEHDGKHHPSVVKSKPGPPSLRAAGSASRAPGCTKLDSHRFQGIAGRLNRLNIERPTMNIE
jgi:small-conductance mechanosensitive channel